MSDVVRLLAPALAWLAAFSAVYGLQGLSCADAFDLGPTTWRALLIAAWGLAVALQLAIIVALRRPAESHLVSRAATLVAWSFLAATVWSLFPVVVVSRCG